MWAYITINIILALLSILLIQHLWDYFKNTYTEKKTKDLAEFQTQKYKDMFLTIQNAEPIQQSSMNLVPDSVVVASTFLPPNEKEWLIAELEKDIINL